MEHWRRAGWINSVISAGMVIVFLVAITAGQFYITFHFDSPWREILMLASLPVEYLGLAYWSAWTNREVDAPALAERYGPFVDPVVLASSGAPSQAAIDETSRIAHELHKPVLLVNLMTRTELDPSWIEGVWARLAEQGVRVSAQDIFTQEPERTVDEIAGAIGASHVILGQRTVTWSGF